MSDLFKIALVGLLIIFIGSCYSSTTNASENDNVKLDQTEYTISPLPDTDIKMAEKIDEKGTRVESGWLQGNKKIGTWKTFNPSTGRLLSSTEYLNSMKEGMEIKYSNRGQINEKFHYHLNKLHGSAIKYSFGNVMEVSNYKDGILDGMYQSYYGNTKLQKEINFSNGKENGSYKYYAEDGRLQLSYEYKNGKKISGGVVE